VSPMRRFAFLLPAALTLASRPSLADTPSPAPVPPPPADGATARVHIVTKSPAVSLEQLQPDASGAAPSYNEVCTTPCDALLPVDGWYRIAGKHVVETRTFKLHAPSTVLSVDARSKDIQTAVAAVGFTGFIVGLVGLVGLVVTAARAVEGWSPSKETTYGLLGALGGGMGVGFVSVGTIVLNQTSVRDEAQQKLARVRAPSGLTATFHF
jgi:hypothetical protein